MEHTKTETISIAGMTLFTLGLITESTYNDVGTLFKDRRMCLLCDVLEISVISYKNI